MDDDRERTRDDLLQEIGALRKRVRELETSAHPAQMYRDLVEQIPAVTYVSESDAQGTALYVSPQVEELTGYSPREFLEDPGLWEKILHPEDRERVLGEFSQSVESGSSFFSRYRIVTRDRRVRWVREERSPVWDEREKRLRYQGVAVDISERVETERQNRLLRKVVEQSPISIVITDVEGTIQYANPYFTDLTGFSLEEALGGKPSILKSGAHEPAFYQELWKTIRSGRTWRGEIYNKKKNGDLYWESVVIVPVKGPQGQIERFIGLKENISERKEVQSALRDRESLLKAVIDSMLVGMILVDAETQEIVDANAFAAKIIGAPREEIVGKSCRFICPAGCGECPVVDLQKEIRQCERTLLTAKGESLPVLKTVSSLRMKGRELLVETFVDLSHLKKAERALQVSHAFLEIAHRQTSLPRMVQEFLGELKALVRCSAVAIRVRRDDGKVHFQVWDGFEQPLEAVEEWLTLCPLN